MNFSKKYLDDTIHAIEWITRKNFNVLISVKKVREFYLGDPSDHSRTNFYWRSLQYLERKGILECVRTQNPKQYRVFNFFKLFELVYDVYKKGTSSIQTNYNSLNICDVKEL